MILGIVLSYFIVYEAYFIVGDFLEQLGLIMLILLFMPYFFVYD
jgi:hypothetical protein